ncbi:MAG: hypothetical protein WAN51_00340, partial [Alphaproteobacteria bacterium]
MAGDDLAVVAVFAAGGKRIAGSRRFAALAQPMMWAAFVLIGEGGARARRLCDPITTGVLLLIVRSGLCDTAACPRHIRFPPTEDWLLEHSNNMFPEDGCLRVLANRATAISSCISLDPSVSRRPHCPRGIRPHTAS